MHGPDIKAGQADEIMFMFARNVLAFIHAS